MVQIALFILALITSMMVNAKHLPLDYGQKNFGLYQGALEPFFSQNSITGQIKWYDQDYLDNYIFHNTQSDLISLGKFINEDFYLAAACSKEELANNYDYIQYAHRLVVLSYLLEMNEILNFNAKKMLFGNVCQTNWDKLLKSCKPQGQYMSFFLKNAKYITDQIQPKRVAAEGSGKRFQQKWLEQLKSGSEQDPSANSIKAYCKMNSCSNLSQAKTLESAFKNNCEYNEKLFKSICSEEDELNALSYIPEMYELIGRSNLLNLIDPDINFQGCLRVYSMYSSRLEKKNNYLSSIVPLLYSKLESEEGYLQGRLYPAGALMEFNIKGLTQVFNDVKKIEDPKPITKVEMKKQLIDTTVVTKIASNPKPTVLPKKTIRAKVKKVAKPIIIKSAFQSAADYLKKNELESVKVDMFKFKYDYIFTLERSRKLDGQLKFFMKRASLQEMKKMDGLGDQKAPVPLIFLKFMIDKNKHQGLFNLVNVVGNEFYVKNTIDSKPNEIDFVQIQNDESTGNRWQISILKK